MTADTTAVQWQDTAWICIDVETTGVDVATSRIVEAAVVCIQHGELIWEWVRRVNPGVPIPASATGVHGITDVDVAGLPGFGSIVTDLVRYVRGGDVVVAYNAPFDVGIIASECWRLERAAPRGLAEAWVWATTGCVVDPLVLVRMPQIMGLIHGQGRHRLGAVAARLGIACDAAHSAYDDAVTAAMVLWILRNDIAVDTVDDIVELVAAQRRLQDLRYEAWHRRHAPRCGTRCVACGVL